MILSIIIPVYNSKEYISRCLESILFPNSNGVEIILIDDGSTDNSLSIINNYANKYPNIIKVISQKNSGQGVARNNGLSIAQGKYVTFIDSDDYISNKEKFYNLLSLCKVENLDILIYNYNVIKNGHIINSELIFDDGRVFSGDEVLKKFLLTNEVEGFSCNKIFRKEILDKGDISFLEGRKFEDIPMVLSAIINSKRIGFINDKLYNYTLYPQSTTNSIDLKMLLDECYSLDLVCNKVLQANSDFYVEVAEYIYYRVILFTYYRMKNLLKKKISYREFKTIIREYINMEEKYCLGKLDSLINRDRNKVLFYRIVKKIYK